MFTLKNKYGNIVKTVETEREKQNLEALGYEVVKPDLDKMKVDELEKFAKEKGIDLSDCKDKPAKLEKIKNSIEE